MRGWLVASGHVVAGVYRLMAADAIVRILVCRHNDCGASFAWPKRELPPTCEACKRDAFWRVADDDEITAFDFREIVLKCGIDLTK